MDAHTKNSEMVKTLPELWTKKDSSHGQNAKIVVSIISFVFMFHKNESLKNYGRVSCFNMCSTSNIHIID